MGLTLYSVSDGPPSLAVRMALQFLGLEFDLVEVDYAAGEFLTDEYAKKNPQKEIPVLDDNGFYLSESNAILQYLADKTSTVIYPSDPRERAIVNHRLAFNLSTYYRSISEYVMAPIFFGYDRTPLGLKKVEMALNVFNIYLEKQKYAAGNGLTIADFPLLTATLCLEGIGFDLSPFPQVERWYKLFKKEYPDLWKIGEGGMNEITEFNKNPPDLSALNHPIHPPKKLKL